VHGLTDEVCDEILVSDIDLIRKIQLTSDFLTDISTHRIFFYFDVEIFRLTF